MRDREEVPPGAPYLLDTHAWIWYVVGSERLPAGVRDELDASHGEVWYSPMSVWELGMLHARGRIELEGGPRQWIDTALARYPLLEAALTAAVALRSHDLDLGHRDPVDHLLAATALIHGLTLLTVDERFIAATWLPTRSS